MLKVEYKKRARKFLEKLPAKQELQLTEKIQSLRENPHQHDVKALQGKLKGWMRADVGEYRIVFFVENETLFIPNVGKRNDGEVYKRLYQFLALSFLH